jgi:2-oxoisovalerate dehydrogenase E1 component
MYRLYNAPNHTTSETSTNKRYIDAISDGLRQSMRMHHNLVIMGQDIAEYGGAFKITQGFLDEFGKDRCATRLSANRALWAQLWGLL